MAGYGVKTPSYGVTDPTKKKQPDAPVAPPNPLYRVMQSNPVSDVLNSSQLASHAASTQPSIRPAASPAPPSTTPAGGTPATPFKETPQKQAPPGSSNADMSGDPILAQLRAISGGYDSSGNFVEGKTIADARTAALAAKKEAFIRSGFGELAQKLLGDANTAAAANANPTSTLAQLVRAHQQNAAGIDTAANKANLYYSSTRANQQGQEAQNYLTNQSNAQSALYDLLSQADEGVLSAKNSAIQQYLAALPEAYQRFLANSPTSATPPPPPSSFDNAGTTGGSSASPIETYYVVGKDGNLRAVQGRPARGLALN